MTERRIWIPQPKQTEFLSAPEDEVLYGGAAGGGKSDSLLIDALGLQQNAIEYPRYRAILFRKTYPELVDLIDRSKELYKQIAPQAKYNGTDKEWRFPSGAAVRFGYMGRPTDRFEYQGHEYCLEVGERVHTDQGLRPIGEIREGDRVLTPTGYRPVTRVFPRRRQPCVRTRFLPSDGGSPVEQVTSARHRTLTTDGSFQLPQSCSIQGVWLWRQTSPQRRAFGGSGRDAGQGAPDGCDSSEGQGTVVEASDDRHRSAQIARLCSSFRQGVQALLDRCRPDRRASTRSRMPRISFEWWLASTAGIVAMLSGPQPLAAQARPVPDRGRGLSALSAGDLGQMRTASGSPDRCSPGHGLCGGRARTGIGTGRCVPLSRSGALDTSLSVTWGDRERGRRHTRPARIEYEHPYQAGRHVRSDLRFVAASSESFPVGMRDTVDITVEGANCYISEAGAVNQNCYIGWDELTQHETDAGYVYLLSRLRTTETNLQVYVRSTCNPGGVGHSWVKDRWMVPDDGAATAFSVDLPDAKSASGTRKWYRRFIPARIADNQYLASTDYESQLHMLSETERKALLDGRWDVVEIVGAIYQEQIAEAYARGRITTVPIERTLPVFTGWDLGRNDHTAVWMMQLVGAEKRFVGYHAKRFQTISWWGRYIIGWAKEHKVVLETHYMPHDVEVRQLSLNNESRREMFERMGVTPITTVERIARIEEGIDMTREFLPNCWFDAGRCKDGIKALANYRREYNETNDSYSATPVHNWASNGADAIRQLAQGFVPPERFGGYESTDPAPTEDY